MKIAFTTTFDAADVHHWSGTPTYMCQALEKEHIEIDYIGSLQHRVAPGFRAKRLWKKIIGGQKESRRFNPYSASQYSQQVAEKLKHSQSQAVLSPLLNPIVYLDCKQPIVLWTDALYSSLLGFYPTTAKRSVETIQSLTREALSRCSLAVFSSDWAAQSAWQTFGIDKNKVKVVPFGANLVTQYTATDIRAMINARSKTCIKFLFIGVSWERKGADIVFNVINALHAAGQTVELNFVGCKPPRDISIPSHIKCHGFISKRDPAGYEKITTLLKETHFLFVPSRAEAYGIVFCEANAFGVPCLTSYVGGIPTIVKDGINGWTFPLDAPVDVYCEKIMGIMRDRKGYEALALSSFNEYQQRLNWQVAARSVKSLIETVI